MNTDHELITSSLKKKRKKERKRKKMQMATSISRPSHPAILTLQYKADTERFERDSIIILNIVEYSLQENEH